LKRRSVQKSIKTSTKILVAGMQRWVHGQCLVTRGGGRVGEKKGGGEGALSGCVGRCLFLLLINPRAILSKGHG